MQQLCDILSILNFLNEDEIEELKICTSKYEVQDNNQLIVALTLQKGLTLNTITKINQFNTNNLKFHIHLNTPLVSLDNAIIYTYINEFLKQVPNLLKIWGLTNFAIDNDTLHIKYHNESQIKEWNDIKVNLLNFLNNVLHIQINDIRFNQDEDIINFNKKVLQSNQEAMQEYQANLKQREVTNTKDLVKYPTRFSDLITLIKDLNFNDKSKVIQGEVFNIKVIKLKNNASIVQYYVADQSSSIIVKDYLKSNMNPPISVGNKVKMIVDVDISNGIDSHEYILCKLKKYEILQEELFNPEANCNHHRVELSLHTKMSAYDGLIDLGSLKKQLSLWGHTHFAITDRYNVQNYPEVAKVFKGSGITPIYGVELEKLPEIIPAIVNPINQDIESSDYIVFDLETTGLHPILDDIIEFGAVKISHNQVVESKQFFIKPNCALSTKISELTNITNEDLEGACDQVTGLKQIVDYVKDAILVAHNGINFDFNFLNIKLVQYGLEPLNNCLVDTMVISRALNDFKGHTLEILSKKFGVDYHAELAHRADYDAKLLAQVWLSLIAKLKELNCTNLNSVNLIIQNDKLRQATRGDFVVVYAKNQQGIKNIYEIISKSHSTQFYGRPTIRWSDLEQFQANLLITNLAIESDVSNLALDGTEQELQNCLSKYDFISLVSPLGQYHEISNGYFTNEQWETAIQKIIKVASKVNKKVVAVSNAYYLEALDKQFHDLYVTMPTLNKKPHRFFKYKTGPLAYLRNTCEMLEEWSFLNDQELINNIVINNSLWVVDQITNPISPVQSKLYPPNIPGVDEKVKNEVYQNAHLRYGKELPKIVEDRIKKELDSIINHGYAVIYWISHLLVKESINDGYVVGSRGSVGSSLVATFLDITDVNPLPAHYLCTHCQYSDFNIDPSIEDGYDLPPITCPNCGQVMQGDGHNILFEVFLGFYGDKVPDIDLNFSGVYQNKAHNFIKKMFGEKYTFRAGTISTIAEKTSYANTRNYFEEIHKDLNPAEIERYTVKCVDVKRTTGQHPGGIIVVPNNMSIFDFTPYNYPADDTTQDWFTTHFAFEYIHDNLLKFDILGHDNPTVLRMLKDLTGVDEKDVPHYDLKTLSLFSSIRGLEILPSQIVNETTGAISIPEFGTKFVREMLAKTKPSSFADLIRISGLSHGTDVWIGNAKDLIQTGLNLNQIIACRDDIMSYLIAHGVDSKLAFNIMEDVRKGKQIKPNDIAILEDHQIPNWYIDSCNKIKYMFPKAHATAYVMHAWKFAWYKLNYPLEYYASYFSIRSTVFSVDKMCLGMDAVKAHYDEINTKIKQKLVVSTKEKDLLPIYEVAMEMFARGFNFKMVSINHSDATNFLIDKEDNSLICPFQVLDGLGDSVANSIIEARNAKPFSSQEDFIKRTKVSRQHITLMQSLKIMDELNENNQIGLFEI